ncbi:MAG TPA: ZIP family metal transporter [Bacteroidales bacterium]|nr:ZIP family metal transporter [Bacteroidales bacterium]HPI29924.1 ZIP family metal transporter [Bacteroidales bacterium]
MLLLCVLLALVAASIGSIALGSLLFLLDNNKLEKVALYLTYLAGGTLLGAAFLGMIPRASEMMQTSLVLKLILAGLLFFFVLEKFILWRTCRNKECERHVHAVVPMILFGDAFHNAIDGIVIVASFLTSPEMGFFVTLSVAMHEIPQELGDFGILLHSGMTRKKALLYNMLSGSTAIVAGIAAFYFLDNVKMLIPYVLAFSASSFLYIALADLIPEMHKKTKVQDSLLQFLLIVSGIVIIYLIK